MAEKTNGELLKEKLCYKKKSGYEVLSDEEIAKAYAFCEDYKVFLDQGKTERECVSYAVSLAEKRGFAPFDKKKKYKAGDKVYQIVGGKAAFFVVFGEKPVDEGVLISAAHIDSPRLDLKPRPLYEDNEMAFFKTHYYGGVKKYQWSTIPLALHGIVVTDEGETVNVRIGEDENDPVFVLTDLLPHLAKDQMEQTVRNAFKGESMNILVGSRPFKDDKASEKIKLNILSILNEKYGIIESDLVTAELEIVPAFKAKDVGLDRSLIGAYGHDDRVCSYASLQAIFDTEKPVHTCLCALVDKEEIGSEGVTGMKSYVMRYLLMDIAESQGADYKDMFRRSYCLSADVNVAFDPNFPEVTDVKNTGFVNCGVTLAKYTGSGGKSGSNDAPAEFLAAVVSILKKNTFWQIGELGKVDQGGGGTVAKYIAELGVNVIDIGVAMLSMHAPWEVVGKLDVYSTYKAVLGFNRHSIT